MKIIRSFSYAWNGIKTSFISETNFKIHTAFAVLAIALAVMLGISSVEWIVVLFCIALVMLTEMLNTAIEKLCDLVQPDMHPVIKKVKDITAGAVLIAAVCSLIAGIIIFLPAIMHCIKNR